VTTSDQEIHPSAPTVVPRWEWRTFGDDLEDADRALASLGTAAAVESDETYLLSMYGDASIKVRGGVLDVKVLERVNGAGLQLWVPTMKAPFPLDERAIVAAFAALGAPLRATRRSEHSIEELVDELVGPRDDLRVVETHKRRRRSLLDDCMVELTEVSAEGRTTRTVAVESPDPGLVTETVRRLGLDGRPNVCVARGLKSLLGWGPTRFAVIDVGTNSVKFTLGHRDEGGVPRSEVDTAVVTRLGEGLADAGELTPVAMGRTIDAIAGLVDEARRGGPVDIVAVGTAGLRQAPNRDAFVEAVHTRCGIIVEVISGQEEARLAYLAAVSTLPLTGDRLLVFDSGGGSSQFTFGRVDRIEEQFSVDVGAVRFTERFGLADAVPRETVDAALTAIAADLVDLRGRPRPDMVIAIGGTSTNLAAVKHGLDRYDPDVVHGTVVDVAEVDRQIEAYRRLSADERREITGLQPARAEVILAGACIVRTILTLTGQEAVTVSDRGLRHGVIAERFGSREVATPSIPHDG
jgi:exopolyphosphatase/guanosine-5'-triphosphate,3'-diphosphate pyrophosphatase